MSRNERLSQARQAVAQATSNLPGRPNASVVTAEPVAASAAHTGAVDPAGERS
jgi:hypothetical protein